MGHRAGFWIRVVAALIDSFALLALLVAYYAVFTAVWQLTYDEQRSQMIADVVFCVGWLAYTSTEIWFAATPGKLATGLRIRQLDCGRADWWRLFLRWQTKHYGTICAVLFALGGGPGCYVLGGFMNGVVFIGSFFASNDDRLTWHDQLAATSVCWRQKPDGVTAPPPLPALR